MAINTDDIKDAIVFKISDRLESYDLSESEIKGDFDLVKSGLMDSMSFVELVGSMEEKYQVEIDFEKIMEDEKFTTISGLVNLFNDTING